jgi:hypothetical protein
MYASSRVPLAASITAIACSRVSDFEGRPVRCPLGGLTSAATFRAARPSRSAWRIARTSTLREICTVRVDVRDARTVSAPWTSLAIRSLSFTAASCSLSIGAIVFL